SAAGAGAAAAPVAPSSNRSRAARATTIPRVAAGHAAAVRRPAGADNRARACIRQSACRSSSLGWSTISVACPERETGQEGSPSGVADLHGVHDTEVEMFPQLEILAQLTP